MCIYYLKLIISQTVTLLNETLAMELKRFVRIAKPEKTFRFGLYPTHVKKFRKEAKCTITLGVGPIRCD